MNQAFEKFVHEQASMQLSDLAYSVIGLCGEAGEVAEWYKKVHMRSKPTELNETDLLSELGDVMHYVTRIALVHGWTLNDCMLDNLNKITARAAKEPPSASLGIV